MYDFTTLLIDGIPLVIVVFGIVEFMKTMGLQGKGLTVASLLLGLLFGIAYRLTLPALALSGTVPADFAGLSWGFRDWFSAVVFGLALGLVASGLYDFANSRLPRMP